MAVNIFDENNKVLNKVFGNWMRFKEIGDKIHGTYTGKSVRVNQYDGTDQNIYEITDDNGVVFFVGGKPGIDMQMSQVSLGQIVGMEFIKQTPPKSAGMRPANIIQVYANKEFVNKTWLLEQRDLGGLDEELNLDESPKNQDSSDPSNADGLSVPPRQGQGIDESSAPFKAGQALESSINQSLPANEVPFKSNELSGVGAVQEIPNSLKKNVVNTNISTDNLKHALKRITEIATVKLGASTPSEVKLKVMEKTGVAFVNENIPRILELLESEYSS